MCACVNAVSLQRVYDVAALGRGPGIISIILYRSHVCIPSGGRSERIRNMAYS